MATENTNLTIYDEDEFIEDLTGDYDENGNPIVKEGFIYQWGKKSKCANCLQELVMPIPFTGIWYHRDPGYSNEVCDSPTPAPSFFLLEIENNPRMNPGGYRSNNKKIICRTHSGYWDILINQFLGAKPKSKKGWTPRIGWSSGCHYILDNYKTACGISIPYKDRVDNIHYMTKIPEHPASANRYVTLTCTKCYVFFEKIHDKKKTEAKKNFNKLKNQNKKIAKPVRRNSRIRS